MINTLGTIAIISICALIMFYSSDIASIYQRRYLEGIARKKAESIKVKYDKSYTQHLDRIILSKLHNKVYCLHFHLENDRFLENIRKKGIEQRFYFFIEVELRKLGLYVEAISVSHSFNPIRPNILISLKT